MIRPITLEEVKQHKTADDCWMVLNGHVFNLTEYCDYHPGGVKKLLLGCGRDGTKLFNHTHSWVNWEHLLQKCYLGPLKHTSISEVNKNIKKNKNNNNNNNNDNNSNDNEDNEELNEEEIAATVFPAPEGPQNASKC
eukprot:TRINITY_DN1264_c5_g1_i1.p1 TRINITY_DN1264_c5_g1~~TRINITY_DN1264_c5_g1_i1.p1  ORF type:complete len:137 (-),score=48.13 TRINITY_DN1264_c5_g1_i1:165-575(-)